MRELWCPRAFRGACWAVALGVLVALGGFGCATGGTTALAPADAKAIRSAAAAYEAAWLTNDPGRVMATLTEDAVIVPSGLAPISGQAAIRTFWFPPEASPTLVTRFEATQDEVGGAGDVAFVRGRFTLAFRYSGADYESAGTYLTLLRREGGVWRISHRMWSDRPPAE